MPLMVVDGAAGDCEVSTSSGMWSAGRCFLALVLGEICGENDYVGIRRLSGNACWLFYGGKVYRPPVSVELLQLFVRNPIYLGEVR
jgi:hypothetical protein